MRAIGSIRSAILAEPHSLGSCPCHFPSTFIPSLLFSSHLDPMSLPWRHLLNSLTLSISDYPHNPLTPTDSLTFLDDYDHDFTTRYYQHDQVHPLSTPENREETCMKTNCPERAKRRPTCLYTALVLTDPVLLRLMPPLQAFDDCFNARMQYVCCAEGDFSFFFFSLSV
ncbi:hypothetical protein P170DRAFT_178142 [Aspergillus steynii IBT 23096]|uniref:Uncharacterized protein n=1 Tax=Aspergillus steynii IBT 23096 TaxID=1392250 RepID=A0A2I2G8M9_9EURO|nr:uncharacterized protein P170DRAFT_178142 [Aspergillus steynii IBT 23096]PLB49236.1 hypothetical protein P170DRAFT_178142 [Aspergillus steynii IBT 23096]